jgi:hypothetical protein
MKILKILSLLVLFTTTKLFSQTNITSTTTVVENFNLMGSSANATLPTGFKLGTDWSLGTTATTQAAGTSGTGILNGTSTGGAYNFANGITASSTDRAIGFLSSGSYSSPRSIIYAFTNNTGSTVTSLSLSWNYEKYRSGMRDFNWTFFHGSTSTVTTAATSGDQAYLADANNTVVSNPPASTAKSFSITGLSISNGSTYYLRWTYTGNGGSTNSQGLGIDDFSITVTTSAPTATITGGTTTSPFTTTYGTTSTPQSFSISGSNLTASITATAPAGFEVSNDGITYGGTTTFTQTSGSASGTLTIRLKANAPAGAYNSNNIVLSSTGASSVNITTPSTGNLVSTKTLTITGISFNNKVYDGTTTVTISGTPIYVGLVNSESFSVSGTVTWAFSSANVGSAISITRTGSYNAPSSNYTVTQPTGFANITKANQTITYNDIPFKCLSDVDFVPATSSSGLTLTLTSSNTSIATIVSNKVRIIGNGTCTITASQAGNTNYFAATNKSKTLIVKSPTSRWSFESVTISNIGTTPNFLSSSQTADIGDLTTGSKFTGFHSSNSTTWSCGFGGIVGNSSSKSLHVTNWSVGDYFQFELSTKYYDSLLLTVEQTSSGSGPRDFKLQYSLDGTSYTDITTYQVPYFVSGPSVYAWSSTSYQSQSAFSFNLSLLTQIQDQSLVYFRLVNTSTLALLGGTVLSAGTSRVDNISLMGNYNAPLDLEAWIRNNPKPEYIPETVIVSDCDEPSTYYDFIGRKVEKLQPGKIYIKKSCGKSEMFMIIEL